jgi:hypothetical protein
MRQRFLLFLTTTTAALLFLSLLPPSGVAAATTSCLRRRRLQTSTAAPSETCELDFSGLCFPEDATVHVLDQGEVPMKDLRVGDLIQTMTLQPVKNNNQTTKQDEYYYTDHYQPIYAFGHYQPDQEEEYLQIQTKDNYSNMKFLTISHRHMVFLYDKKNPVAAESIQLGDVLQSDGGSPAKVIQIDVVTKRGLYAPLTPDGTLLVNGIQASSYVSLQPTAHEFVEWRQGGTSATTTRTLLSQQNFVHWATAPLRLLCPSSRRPAILCQPQDHTDGMPYYVYYGLKLAHWTDQQRSGMAQLVVFGLVMSCLLPFVLVESVILAVKTTCSTRSSSMALMTILTSILGTWWVLKKKVSSKTAV